MLSFSQYLLTSILIFVDALCLYAVSGRFLLTQYDKSIDLSLRQVANTLAAVSVWCLRGLFIYYLFLIPMEPAISHTLTLLIFLFPTFLTILFYKSILKSRNGFFFKGFQNIRSIFLSILLILTGTLFQSAGETSWDGSSYHLPMEKMLKDSGGFWGWPDLIYSQWQLSGIESSFATYNIVFSSDRAALLISFMAFISLYLVFSSSYPKYKTLVFLIFASIPALLQQVSTRYIDMIIAVASVCGILIIQQNNLHQYFKFSPFVLSFPVLSYAFSGKWTAVVSEVVAFVIVALYSNHFLKSKKFILPNVLTILFSLGVGLFPIVFRNFVSFQNPLYPFQFGPFRSGYFSLSSYSDHLGDLYASQVNWSSYSIFEQGVREYLFSPFQTIFALFLKIPDVLALNFAPIIQDPFFYRTFVYDNRLGGFGPVTLLILLILTFFLRLSYREIAYFWIVIVAFFFLPSSIHSRYYLTVGIVLVWIFLDICAKRNFAASYKNPVNLSILIFALVFASVNVASLTYRLFPTGITNYPVDQSTSDISSRINPDCSEILHVGSGLWGVVSVWGPNLCGSVYGGINVNGFLFESKIGNPKLTENDLESIYSFAIKENGSSKRIICSFPKAKENPCSEIKNKLQKEFGIVTVSSGYVSEASTGPTLESLLIVSK